MFGAGVGPQCCAAATAEFVHEMLEPLPLHGKYASSLVW
jgi:hypothetical protein